MAKIFCYGTLRKGRDNHRFVKNQTYLGEFYTDKNYTLLLGRLPYLIERDGDGCRGEVYEVSDMCLRALDSLEGHPVFYERKFITVYNVETKQAEQVQAYIHPDNFNPYDESEKLIVIREY
jgi:gamma-glutamylcyclotransferase (GGCT)/AIG2-like uncharacterized protein YtfP